MKKRVAFCLRDMQMGGVESVLVRTLEHLLRDKNLDVTIVTFVDVREPFYQDWFRKHKSVKRIVLYPSRFFGTKMPRFFVWRVLKHMGRDLYRWWRRMFYVKRMLAGFDTFIDYHDFGFYKELKKVFGAKKIAWFHSGLKVFVKQHFVQRLAGYDNVVVLTDDCMGDLKKLCPQYKDKFIRIYNPIDINAVREKSDVKREISFDYFCCVSRMSYDKDIKTLLDGFNLFWHDNKDVRLVIVGGGDKTDIFKNYANGLAAHKNILFVGAKQNPYGFMRYAIANILSSYAEGFGQVLIEAGAVGCVNISANCKYGPREILLDGRAGVLFEPGNAEQLAQCMMDVYHKRVNVKKMRDITTKELKRFDANEIVKQVKSLIS